MSIFENIINGFNSYIDAISGNTEPLTPYLAEAAHLITHTLLEDNKILCCSSGPAFAIGQQFCANLANSPKLQRPGFPAVFLGASQQHAITMIDQNQPNNIYARQVQALGREGDLLLVVASSGQEKPLLQALQAATECDMPAIVLCGGNYADVNNAMCSHSVAIPLRCQDADQTLAMQFMTVNLLTDLVEQLMFGTS